MHEDVKCVGPEVRYGSEGTRCRYKMRLSRCIDMQYAVSCLHAVFLFNTFRLDFKDQRRNNFLGLLGQTAYGFI